MTPVTNEKSRARCLQEDNPRFGGGSEDKKWPGLEPAAGHGTLGT